MIRKVRKQNCPQFQFVNYETVAKGSALLRKEIFMKYERPEIEVMEFTDEEQEYVKGSDPETSGEGF